LNASAATGGLGLSTQEITFRAATNAQTGYATAAHITAIEANTTKNTNVSTALSTGTVDGTSYGITSDGGTNDVILAQADTNNAGVLSNVKWDEIVANTLKNTNVPTALSVGTVGVNTVAITSDGGADDVTLPAATVSAAGMLTTAKWGEIVANNAKVTESTTVSSPLVLSTYNISMLAAATSTDGYLAQADWNTFNGKLASADINTFSELDAIVADKALVNKADGAVWLGEHDFGGAGIEVENNTSVPGSCTVGQIFMDTDATSGQQLYGCESGSFVQQGGSGSGDVTAVAAITDHSLVRGNGGVKGVQDSGIIIDDLDNISEVNSSEVNSIEIKASATPTVAFIDSDTTDEDISTQIITNCTDTGSGTEDCDMTFNQQIAGVLTAFLTVDADGLIAFGRGVSAVSFGGPGDPDTYVGFGTPDAINYYAGAINFLQFTEGATDFIKFNPNGVDIDFGVETAAEPLAFVIDGGAETATFNIPLTVNDPLTVTSGIIGEPREICFIIDGGGSAITTGAKAWVRANDAFAIIGVEMTSDTSTTTVVDLWKDTYANFPPTDADTITASAVPTITTAIKSQDETLTAWTTAVSEGDYIRANVDSNDNSTLLEVCIYGTSS